MTYTLYTDGAFSRKHNEGAFAYVMLDANGNVVKKLAKKITDETNNRAELKAIIAGIYLLPQDAEKVKVISDSQYALNTLFGGWSRNANDDLFKIFDDIMSKRTNLNIEWEWVRGHSGNEYNEMCDKMRNDALGYDANAEYDKYKKNKQMSELGRKLGVRNKSDEKL